MDQNTYDAVAVLVDQQAENTAAIIKAINAGNYPWWYPESAKDLMIEAFQYGIDWDPLAATASEGKPFQVDSGMAFVLLSTMLVETATDYTTFLTQWPLLVNIKSSSSSANLSNIPMSAGNWFGTAQRPKFWDVPRILPPSTSMMVTMQNLEATPRVVRAAFAGFHIYEYKP